MFEIKWKPLGAVFSFRNMRTCIVSEWTLSQSQLNRSIEIWIREWNVLPRIRRIFTFFASLQVLKRWNYWIFRNWLRSCRNLLPSFQDESGSQSDSAARKAEKNKHSCSMCPFWMERRVNICRRSLSATTKRKSLRQFKSKYSII